MAALYVIAASQLMYFSMPHSQWNLTFSSEASSSDISPTASSDHAFSGQHFTQGFVLQGYMHGHAAQFAPHKSL
jgi:hypothetical protein